jgi:hypothetical protein
MLLVCLCVPVTQGDGPAATAGEACPPALSVSPSTPPAAAPTGQPAPGQILVCVASRSITGATFEHWANVARMSTAPTSPPTPGEVLKEVMGFLISSDWVLGEAQALKVHASVREVRRSFEKIRRQEFPKEKEFRAFLTHSGQTVIDLLFRVRLNLLSTRIQKRVLAGHHSTASKRRAISRFVEGFRRKWQARTYCAAEYATVDCGHVQAAPL